MMQNQSFQPTEQYGWSISEEASGAYLWCRPVAEFFVR
jgi:hypothetical protein